MIHTYKTMQQLEKKMNRYAFDDLYREQKRLIEAAEVEADSLSDMIAFCEERNQFKAASQYRREYNALNRVIDKSRRPEQ